MPSGSSSAHAASTPASDWPVQAADTIERVVGSVRDKTTGPAISVARWLVYGTFGLLVGTIVAVLLAIAAVRALDVYLPASLLGTHHTWAAHLLVGAFFSGIGMALWSRRAPRPSAD